MSLIVIGLNHKTAPIELRERLSVEVSRLPELLRELSFKNPEVVVLSTCNHFEIYTQTEQPEIAKEHIVQYLMKRLELPTLKNSNFYQHSDQAAIHHLFSVAAGLDSMVVGEHEILGQVKNAYLTAQSTGTTGKALNVLFQRSLFVGKKVRTETGLSQGSQSVASVAVTLAQRIFGDLKNNHAMVLGAGEIAELTAKHLLSQKVHSLIVANRTYDKAVALATTLHATAVSFEQGLQKIADIDIVICSTASPTPLITRELVERIMEQRRHKLLFFIDIAMPRDVHPDVHTIDGVYVYNIDDLQSIVDENKEKRSGEVQKAETIIEKKAQEFSAWLGAHHAGQDYALKHDDD